MLRDMLRAIELAPTLPKQISSRGSSRNIHQRPRLPVLQGTIKFTGVISNTGKVERLDLVRGHPLLVKAAQDAVLQWEYRPILLNGSPVEVIADVL